MTSTSAKPIDLDDSVLKPNDSGFPSWAEIEHRTQWQQENFVFVRDHDYQGRPEAIWSGKDGKTILVIHRDYSCEYYYDQYWDIYQENDDGSLTVKKMTYEEMSIGHGDSIPMLAKTGLDKIEGVQAAAIRREIAAGNTSRAFHENRESIKEQTEREFPSESFVKLIYPRNDGHDVENERVVSNLPYVLFNHVAHDKNAQEEQNTSFTEWLYGEASTFYNVHDNVFPKKTDERTFNAYEPIYYNAVQDILVIKHRVPYEEYAFGDYHQIYEFISDHIVRTTVETSQGESGTGGGKRDYVSGIKKQIVSDGDEMSRILQERAAAIDILRSQKASDAFNDQTEADTKNVSYKASGPQPS